MLYRSLHVKRLTSSAGALCALFFLAVVAMLVKPEPASWNDISRTATIESLVERRTFAINDSPWASKTMDKVLLNGNYYSEKVPLLSFLGAGVYAILYNLGGTLAVDCGKVGGFCACPWTALVLDSLPAALLLWLFFEYGRQRGLSLWVALVATLALGFGTMIFPYSTVINNHVPAAACLFASFYLIVVVNGNDRWRLACAGFLSVLSVVLDVSSVPIAASLWIFAFARYRIASIALAFAIFIPPLSKSWKHLAWLIFVPLLALSIYSTQQGARRPWVDWQPPIYLTSRTELPFVGLNFSFLKSR